MSNEIKGTEPGLFKQLYNVGLSESLYKISGSLPDGKLVKLLIASYNLGSHYSSNLKVTFGLFIAKAVTPAKDFIYGMQWIGGIADLSTIKATWIKNQNESKGRGPTIATALFALGNISEAGRFAKKYGIYDFPLCSKICDALGKFQVYGVKPFTIKPFSFFCDNPKGFFVYIASFVRIGTAISNFVFAEGNTEQKKAKRNEELQTKNLLVRAGDIGKIILIHYGNTSYKSLWYAWIDFGTQTVSLLSLLIKKG